MKKYIPYLLLLLDEADAFIESCEEIHYRPFENAYEEAEFIADDVKKRKRVAPFFKIKNLYLRTLLRMTVNPGAAFYVFISFVERGLGFHRDKISADGFMDEVSFWEDV